MSTINLGRVQGDSAYQTYVKTTTDNPIKTEAQWMVSLKGEQGLVGPKGDKGDKGDTGPQGIQGPKGDPGSGSGEGIPGPKGDKGDKGDTGAVGPKGDTGAQGIQGIAGPKGDKGDTGAQGPQGIQGPRGDGGNGGGVAIQNLPSFIQLKPHPHAKNPVLTKDDVTDVTASFVADPFIVRDNGMYYMFFEVLDASDNLGKIGLATSVDGLDWTYKKLIFSPGTHVSFPHVFKHEGNWYMTVENYVAGNGLRLYKFNNFPEDPILEATLAPSRIHVDGVVFKYKDYWYIFSNSHGDQNLFFSETLTGTYTFHSSLWTGSTYAQRRPAGRAIVYDDCVDVPIQDNTPRGYGSRVNMYRLTNISPNPSTPVKFHMFDSPLVQGSDVPNAWNKNRMHSSDFLLNEDFSLPSSESTLVAVDGELTTNDYSIGIYTIDNGSKQRYLRLYNGNASVGLAIAKGINYVTYPLAANVIINKNTSFDITTGVFTALESGMYTIDFGGHLFLETTTPPYDIEVLLQRKPATTTTYTDIGSEFFRPISGTRIGIHYSDCVYLSEGESIRIAVQNGGATSTTLKFYRLAICKISDLMS